MLGDVVRPRAARPCSRLHSPAARGGLGVQIRDPRTDPGTLWLQKAAVPRGDSGRSRSGDVTETGPLRGSAPGLSLPLPRAHGAGSRLVWGQNPAFRVASSAAWQHVCVSQDVREKTPFLFFSLEIYKCGIFY